MNLFALAFFLLAVSICLSILGKRSDAFWLSSLASLMAGYLLRI